MKPYLSWPQRLIAAPLFGAFFCFGRYFQDSLSAGANAQLDIGLFVAVTVGVLMALWLISFVRFERPFGGAHRR